MSLAHVEEGAENFRQLWFLEQPDPKEPHRKVPSKTAVLVRIMFSCCNKEPPHKNRRQKLASLSCLGLEADSPGLAWQGCSRKLLSLDALSSQRHCPHPGRTQARMDLQPQSSRSHQQDRGRSREKSLPLPPRKYPRSHANCFPFHSGGRAQSHNQPSCRGGWALLQYWVAMCPAKIWGFQITQFLSEPKNS